MDLVFPRPGLVMRLFVPPFKVAQFFALHVQKSFQLNSALCMDLTLDSYWDI